MIAALPSAPVPGELTPCVSLTILSGIQTWESNEERVPVALLNSPEYRARLALLSCDRVRYLPWNPWARYWRPSFSEPPQYGTVPLGRAGT